MIKETIYHIYNKKDNECIYHCLKEIEFKKIWKKIKENKNFIYVKLDYEPSPISCLEDHSY
jgi:hypothetical protein